MDVSEKQSNIAPMLPSLQTTWKPAAAGVEGDEELASVDASGSDPIGDRSAAMNGAQEVLRQQYYSFYSALDRLVPRPRAIENHSRARAAVKRLGTRRRGGTGAVFSGSGSGHIAGSRRNAKGRENARNRHVAGGTRRAPGSAGSSRHLGRESTGGLGSGRGKARGRTRTGRQRQRQLRPGSPSAGLGGTMPARLHHTMSSSSLAGRPGRVDADAEAPRMDGLPSRVAWGQGSAAEASPRSSVKAPLPAISSNGHASEPLKLMDPRSVLSTVEEILDEVSDAAAISSGDLSVDPTRDFPACVAK